MDTADCVLVIMLTVSLLYLSKEQLKAVDTVNQSQGARAEDFPAPDRPETISKYYVAAVLNASGDFKQFARIPISSMTELIVGEKSAVGLTDSNAFDLLIQEQ